MRTPVRNRNVALFSGAGELPRLVHNGLVRCGARVCLFSFSGSDLTWVEQKSVEAVSLHNFREKFDQLAKNGIKHVVFAGNVKRPAGTETIDDHGCHPAFPFDIADGDDAVLRSAVRLVESWGFNVIGPHEILPELIAESGVLTHTQPSEQDRRDVARAEKIVQALGAVDVGQAVVVANMICIAVETIAGTDAMLSSAASTLKRYRPASSTAVGVMFKAPKTGQELRVDMPVIGPGTILKAASANIRGVAIEAGGVMILDRDKTVRRADANNIFVWSRQPSN